MAVNYKHLLVFGTLALATVATPLATWTDLGLVKVAPTRLLTIKATPGWHQLYLQPDVRSENGVSALVFDEGGVPFETLVADGATWFEVPKNKPMTVAVVLTNHTEGQYVRVWFE